MSALIPTVSKPVVCPPDLPLPPYERVIAHNLPVPGFKLHPRPAHPKLIGPQIRNCPALLLSEQDPHPHRWRESGHKTIKSSRSRNHANNGPLRHLPVFRWGTFSIVGLLHCGGGPVAGPHGFCADDGAACDPRALIGIYERGAHTARPSR